MGERIPQSTSYELAFKVYSASTGLEVTGATVAMTISKNGATGAFSAMHVATNATEIASGWYFVVLDSTDTATLGRLAVRGTSTGNQDVGVQLTVVNANNAGLAGIPDAAPGATNGLFIAGTNAATTITTALTTTFTGNLTGSVGSVTGLTASNLDTTVSSRMATYTQPTGFLAATFPSGTIANTTNITSITGNITGNLSGSVGSVTSRVTANTDQWAGGTIPAVNVTGVPLVDLKYTLGTLSPAAAGSVGVDWAQVANKTSTVALTGTTVGTVTTVTNQLTAAQIATGVWQDAAAGDFTTANSVGKSLYNAFTANTSVYTTAALANAPTSGTPPTVGQIATAVWQDSTVGDFTAANSIGKSVLNGVALGTGLTVAAVSGAVGSVTSGVTVTTNNDKTGYSLTQAFPTNFGALSITAGGHISNVDTLTTYTGDTPQTGDSFARIGAAGAGLTALGDPRIAHLDADVSTRLATSGYTAPDNADVAAIKAKTDSLAFTTPNKVDANILAVNSDTVTGDGHTGTEWGPA